MKQTKLRTYTVRPNQNITFPIGTVLTVQQYAEKLDFLQLFGQYKKRGRDLDKLVAALVSYKLTENFSISRACDWINRDEVLKRFSLAGFEKRTLFRCLEILGDNAEQVMADLQDLLFAKYNFSHTDVVLDWTSLVLHGDKCKIADYGYSRDHRPDKKQITIGISQLASPINVPIGLTVKAGNTNDMTHFASTYTQARKNLRKGSLVTFDKGAHSKENISLVLNNRMKYLTSKKLNKSDDKRIAAFDKKKATLVDAKRQVYGIKFEKPSRFDYFFFSQSLKEEQVAAKKRKALKKFEEAKDLQTALDKGRTLPKRYQLNNKLVDVTYTYQTKLKELGEEEAKKFIEKGSLNGREGFFCIVSSKNLTLQEALETYRKKDTIEKVINSLKNEIEIKPLRVWTEKSINGALIIGFLAQLIISLLRYECEEIKQKSTKFIKKSLMNLTVTVEFCSKRAKRYIYANFDHINKAILGKIKAIT